MGIFSRLRRRLVKAKPAYVMTVSPTPAGKSWTTEGKLISTPGTPATPGFSLGGSGSIARREATRRAEEAARKAREEAARKELERIRREAMAREAARKETARKNLEQALARAKASKSMSAQARAREVFQRAQETAIEERKRIIQQPSETFRKVIEAQRKTKEVPRAIPEETISEIKSRALELEKKFVKTGVGKVFDVVSGGTLTERKLRRQSSDLNKDIEEFNKRFGGRELSEKQFNEAKRIENEIRKQETKIIKKKDELATSAKSQLASTIWGRHRATEEQREKEIKNKESGVRELESKLKSLDKKGLLTKIRKKSLEQQIKGANKEISRLEAGGDVVRVMAGMVPITPVGVTVIPRNIKVGFIGTQKIKKGKIITDVVFKVGKRRIGIAKGVTVIRGKTATTVTLGKSGVRGIKFPFIKPRVVRKEVFVGVEKAISKPAKFAKVLRRVKVSKALRKQLKLPKRIEVIRRNIKGFRQAGVGRVMTVKGEKFVSTRIKFPSAKIVQERVTGISVKDFASMSRVLTKKDLSVIIGKAITTNKDKVHFIGLIKGTSKVGKVFKLTGVQQQQYKVALQKVASVVAAAAKKSNRVKGITSAQRLALTQQFARDIIKPTRVVKPVPVLKPKLKLKVRPAIAPLKAKQIIKARAKQSVLATQLSKQGQSMKQRIRQLEKARQKAKTKLAQRSLQRQRQKLKLRLQTLTIQKGKLVGINIRPGFIPTPAQMRILGLVIPKPRKKPKVPKKKPEVFQGYNVYGKYKGKFMRLNKIPLSKKDALHRGAFAIDKSTANTFKIKGVRKVKKLGKLTKGEKGHFPKTRKKYRSYRIQKGRRITLKDKYIERLGKPRIDTRGEKRGLTLARLAKQRGFIGRRTPMRSTHSTSRRPVRRKSRMKVHTRSPVMKPQMKIKKVIKKAPKGKKPTRYRFKGSRRLGFRNNKVVEIVQFKSRNPTRTKTRKPTPTQSNYNQELKKTIKRKASPAQLKALAEGRKIRQQNLKKRK